MPRNNRPFVPYGGNASANNSAPLPMPDQWPDYASQYGSNYTAPGPQVQLNNPRYAGGPSNNSVGFMVNAGQRTDGGGAAPSQGYREAGGYNDASGVYWPDTTTTTQPGWGSNLFNGLLRTGVGVLGSAAGSLLGPVGSLAGGIGGRIIGNRLFHGGPTVTHQSYGPTPTLSIGADGTVSGGNPGGTGTVAGIDPNTGRQVMNATAAGNYIATPPATNLPGHFGSYYGPNGFTNEVRQAPTNAQESALITSMNDQQAGSVQGALRLPDERGTFSPGVHQTGQSGYLGNEASDGNTVGSWAGAISPDASAAWQQSHAGQLAGTGRHGGFQPLANPAAAPAPFQQIPGGPLPPITQPPSLGDPPQLSSTGIPVMGVNGNPTFQGPLQLPQLGAVGPNGQPINPVFQGPVQTPSQQYQAAMARMQTGGA